MRHSITRDKVFTSTIIRKHFNGYLNHQLQPKIHSCVFYNLYSEIENSFRKIVNTELRKTYRREQ